MTQEEKDLLLKDLCARLSYGVVWCVRCGLLSTSVGNAEKLSDEQLIIK